jgi:hypothetical protein
MEITFDQVKKLYRETIDPQVSDNEGSDWWASVATDVAAVINARGDKNAARVIAWWHSEFEWEQIGDTAADAAKRLRSAAQCLRPR